MLKYQSDVSVSKNRIDANSEMVERRDPDNYPRFPPQECCAWTIPEIALKKIAKHYKRVGYNMDIMRQSACMFVNPITVYNYGFLFNCTTVGQASDSMTTLTLSFNMLIGT